MSRVLVFLFFNPTLVGLGSSFCISRPFCLSQLAVVLIAISLEWVFLLIISFDFGPCSFFICTGANDECVEVRGGNFVSRGSPSSRAKALSIISVPRCPVIFIIGVSLAALPPKKCDLLHTYPSRLRYLLYYPIHLVNTTYTTYILLLAYSISAIYPTRLTNLFITM